MNAAMTSESTDRVLLIVMTAPRECDLHKSSFAREPPLPLRQQPEQTAYECYFACVGKSPCSIERFRESPRKDHGTRCNGTSAIRQGAATDIRGSIGCLSRNRLPGLWGNLLKLAVKVSVTGLDYLHTIHAFVPPLILLNFWHHLPPPCGGC